MEYYLNWRKLIPILVHNSYDATFDQEEFGILEDRMSLLESIKRKHGGSIESVLEKRGKIENEITELSNSDQLAESLADQIIKMEKKFF